MPSRHDPRRTISLIALAPGLATHATLARKGHFLRIGRTHLDIGLGCGIIVGSVEQTLNLIWLLVVAAIACKSLLWAGHSRDRRAMQLIGLGCIALLLFPVISASDDLHPGFDLSDDAAWRHEKRGPLAAALVALLLAVFIAALLRDEELFAACSSPAAHSQRGYIRLDAGRAPPLSL